MEIYPYTPTHIKFKRGLAFANILTPIASCPIILFSPSFWAISPQSFDKSSREGIIPHKFKRGNLKLSLWSQNHTDHKSGEGLSSSSATSLLTPKTDISPDSHKIRSQLSTLPLRTSLPMQVNAPMRLIFNNIALGIKCMRTVYTPQSPHIK